MQTHTGPDGRGRGGSGKLIKETRGGPAADFLGYWKTVLKYYRVWEEGFRTDKAAMAQAIAHLRYIRDEEAKEHPGIRLIL